VVKNIKRINRDRPQDGMNHAYFYFAHPIAKDCSVETVLRAILAQLIEGMSHWPPEIEELYSRSEAQDISTDAILNVLQNVVLYSKHVYLAFDAIDEGQERPARFIQILTGLSDVCPNLSVIFSTDATSQIPELSLPSATCIIDLEEPKIEHNLNAYFQRRLRYDEQLCHMSSQQIAEARKALLMDSSGALYGSDQW
jgi:hypothetical protein